MTWSFRLRIYIQIAVEHKDPYEPIDTMECYRGPDFFSEFPFPHLDPNYIPKKKLSWLVQVLDVFEKISARSWVHLLEA